MEIVYCEIDKIICPIVLQTALHFRPAIADDQKGHFFKQLKYVVLYFAYIGHAFKRIGPHFKLFQRNKKADATNGQNRFDCWGQHSMESNIYFFQLLSSKAPWSANQPKCKL